ncbi:unnamed protein product [Ectocarpus fasciculatus]
MGSGDSKPAGGGVPSRKRRKESPLLLPHEESSGKARQGQGTPLLGPAERSERRFLRNYDLDDGITQGGGIPGGVGGRGRGGHSGGGCGGGGERDGGDDGVADIDQSIDRYDYLIAFPHPREQAARAGGRGRRSEDTSTGDGYGKLSAVGEGEGSDDSDSDTGGFEAAQRITLTEVRADNATK